MARSAALAPILSILLAVFAVFAPAPAAAAPTKFVLLINSFGRKWTPTDRVLEKIREQLPVRATQPIEFAEFSLEAVHTAGGEAADLAAAYLVSVFANHRPDLIVTVGAPALDFTIERRERFFADVPLVASGVDTLRFGHVTPHRNDVYILNKANPVASVSKILDLFPRARHVYAILGEAVNEQAWYRLIDPVMRAAFPLMRFDWSQGSTLAEIKARLASLDPSTAVIYLSLAKDAAGEMFEADGALPALAAVSKVPIVAIHTDKLGTGALGAVHIDSDLAIERTIESALALLAGRTAAEVRPPPVDQIFVTLDARQLARWDPALIAVPSGAHVLFEERRVWLEYRWHILAILVVGVVQWLLIAFLVASRRRMREAQAASTELRRKLRSAHEDEQRRIARDLHDDIAQRLARLTMDAARLGESPDIADRLRRDLADLGKEVTTVAYRLHPATIERLGVVDALREECRMFADRDALDVQFETRDVPGGLPSALATQLLRIAQEGLRNVARHARATKVNVRLVRVGDGLHLAVEDDGVGFEPGTVTDGRSVSLGLASMRERAELLGGEIEIDARPGEGTTVVAWLPLPPEALGPQAQVNR